MNCAKGLENKEQDKPVPALLTLMLEPETGAGARGAPSAGDPSSPVFLFRAPVGCHQPRLLGNGRRASLPAGSLRNVLRRACLSGPNPSTRPGRCRAPSERSRCKRGSGEGRKAGQRHTRTTRQRRTRLAKGPSWRAQPTGAPPVGPRTPALHRCPRGDRCTCPGRVSSCSVTGFLLLLQVVKATPKDMLCIFKIHLETIGPR